jgi:Mg-chelatase subunit ChlD
MTKNNTIVPGSLSAIAQHTGQALAETFLSVDAILMVDTSGSMESEDAPGNISRHDAAEAELKRLQAQLPGKIAVISFSDIAIFCPGGLPTRLNGGTHVCEALRLVKPADDTGIRFFLISDGQPHDGAEALRLARRFKSKIDVIYIGPERDILGGRKWLEELANATGGKLETSNAPGMLGQPVERLLLEGQNGN